MTCLPRAWGGAHKYANQPNTQVASAKQPGETMIDFLTRVRADWSKEWGCDNESERDEALKLVSELRAKVLNQGVRSKLLDCLTEENLDNALKKFSDSTSTGFDLTTMAMIKALPPCAKRQLLKIFRKSLIELTMPTQVLANLIALLGKKGGGTRCIAVCASFYRLFLAILGEEIRQWDTEVAGAGDTALKGKSPLLETALRHLKVEAYNQLGYSSAIILWDVRKYFDSLKVPTLLERAVDSGFPQEQLVLSMIVHRAAETQLCREPR